MKLKNIRNKMDGISSNVKKVVDNAVDNVDDATRQVLRQRSIRTENKINEVTRKMERKQLNSNHSIFSSPSRKKKARDFYDAKSRYESRLYSRFRNQMGDAADDVTRDTFINALHSVGDNSTSEEIMSEISKMAKENAESGAGFFSGIKDFAGNHPIITAGAIAGAGIIAGNTIFDGDDDYE